MIILDTHVWVRWVEEESTPLPSNINHIIELNESVAVSVISCWEVSYLVKRNRLKINISLEEWLENALEESGIFSLPLTFMGSKIAASLPDIHRDPADRFIIATAIEKQAQLISFDQQFAAYPDLSNLLINK